MRPVLIASVAFLFSCVAAVAQDAQPIPEAPPPAAAPETAPVPQAAPISPSAPSNPAPTGPIILMSTTMGDITIQLYDDRAPKSTANILRYVREKHFDNTAIYRVEKDFVIQMGSYDAKGQYRQTHAPIVLEANNGLSNLRGTLALARGDGPKEGATAEFFINIKDNTALDQHKDDKDNKTGYAVFGQVISGMDVVDQISPVPVGNPASPMPFSAPVKPIVIKKMSIVPAPK